LNNDLIESSLDSLLADGYIAEVLHLVKGGKEGTVYCCRGGPMAGAELVAAKIYHPLERRGFRNDAVYQEGRLRGPRVRRERLAMSKKSGFGRRVQFGVWVNSEFENLRMLHQAGADVPCPIARGESAVLMEFIGDAGQAAPPLAAVELARTDARALFERILRNVALWLERDRIHADLSPYNILYWRGAITVIDFPQAIDARFNPSAHALLERDLANVCRYFARFGVAADPERIARRMWSAYRHGAALS
jgi:RIO kinase 1